MRRLLSVDAPQPAVFLREWLPNRHVALAALVLLAEAVTVRVPMMVLRAEADTALLP